MTSDNVHQIPDAGRHAALDRWYGRAGRAWMALRRFRRSRSVLLAAVGAAAAIAVAWMLVSGRPTPGAPSSGDPAAPVAAARVVDDLPSGRTLVHRFVAPGGSDENPGTSGRPWRTLRHAAAKARAGTTVHVRPGSYRGPVRIGHSGRRGARLRFVSTRKWGAKISATSSDSLAVVDIEGDYVTFQGFDVTGAGGDGTVGIGLDGSHGAIVKNHVHDVAIPCFAGANGGAGIVVGGNDRSIHDGLVSRNLVTDIGTGARDGRCRAIHGIYASVRRVTIANNTIVDAIGDGITSWHAARQLTILNNLSMSNGGAGILVGSGDTGATSAGNRRTLVANNIVYRNALYGIVESSDGSHPVGPGNRYLNNLTFQNRGGDPAPASGFGVRRGATVSGTVNADPQLSPGLRPLRTSPAVDAGTCAARPRDDVLGVSRPQGSTVDIGPYELRSSPGRCGR